MQNVHIRFGKFQFGFVQYVEVFHTHVVFLIEETFFLHTGHVQKIQFRKCIFQAFHFFVRNLLLVENSIPDIAWQAQLLRRNQNEFHIWIANQCLDQRVNCAAEFQVTAQTDGEVAQTSFEGTDGEKVSQCLGRVLMSAVPGVDHRNRRSHGCHQRGSLFRMTDRTDICITGCDTNRVGNTFTLGCGAGIRAGKA